MIYWIALAANLFATVLGQLFFKAGATRRGIRLKMVACGLFLISVPLGYVAARRFGIGQFYICSALAFVIVPVTASLIFNEPLSLTRIFGLMLIVGGIVIYTI